MSENPEPPAPLADAPVTGHALVDEAMAGLAGLDDAALAEHHGRLAQAQDVLAGALDASRQPVHNPVPHGLRPQGTAPQGNRG